MIPDVDTWLSWTGAAPRRLSVDEAAVLVRAEASHLFGVQLRDIKSARRYGRLPLARHWCLQQMRGRGYSFHEIGEAFTLDHTTVQYACRKPPIEVPR